MPMIFPAGVAPMMNMAQINPFFMNSAAMTVPIPGQMIIPTIPMPFPTSMPRSRGISITLGCDKEQLSEYQILLREQLEMFEATNEDVESSTQGRKKKVLLGQVGLRCRHCVGLPQRARGRGAT